MNLTRCENGHFYDVERFDSCPHCNQDTISTVLQGQGDEENKYTMPLNEPASGLGQLAEEITNAKEDDGVVNTIGYFGETEPVVGWLVSIAGSNFGTDFRLKSGKNFIGRSGAMDVALTEDSSVSREKHGIILYEPKSNVFLVQPGDAKELFYLNEKVVLAATEIKAYDTLTLGGTKLLFIPCCSDKFNWDSVKAEEEQK